MFLADMLGTFVNVLLMALGTGVAVMMQRVFLKIFWEFIKEDTRDWLWGDLTPLSRTLLYVIANILAALLTVWFIILSWWTF